MPPEIPREILELRERLAQLEAMAESKDGFNAALRRFAGKARVELAPTEPPEQPAEPAPEPPDTDVTRGVQGGDLKSRTGNQDFNETLRRLRGFGT